MKRLLLLIMAFAMLFPMVSSLGALEVTIGDGDINDRFPFDFWYKNSIYQCLYYPSELEMTSGTISQIKFYNNFSSDTITSKPIKIWLGTTSLESLSSGFVPTSSLTLVYDGTMDFPAGENTITFTLQTPFTYVGGNLVMMCNRVMEGEMYTSSEHFKCQNAVSGRGRYLRSDGTTYDPDNLPAGTATNRFPKTTFVYETLTINNDLAALTISGDVTPNQAQETIYTITIKNNGVNTQSDYQVKLMSGTDTELASVAGPSIESQQTLEVAVPWTPAEAGPLTIYGKVVLTGDEHAINDETEAMSINVMPQGVISVTIGDGSQNLRVPIDFFYKCSLHEALYSPDEIGAFGNINTLMLYNQFPAAAEETPIKIWMGITDLEDLSGGWIPADQLSLVFDGTITFPAGENAVSITLQTPFAYTGGNLVMMFNRPLQPSYLGSAYYFKAQTIGTNRARLARSDSIDYDPANPSATGTLSGQIPMITMLLTPLSDEPTFSIFPSAADLGNVLLDTTVDRTFTIRNVGGGNLGINSIEISGDAFYTIQDLPTLPASLESAQTLTFTVRYAPTAAGVHNATITVNDNRSVHTATITANCIDTNITTLPYTQNFDDVTTPNLPVDWGTLIDSGGSNPAITTVTTSPHSAPYCARIYNGSPAAPTVMLLAPPIGTNIPINTVRLKTWVKGASYNLSIGILEDPLDASTYTELHSMTTSSTWTEVVVPLSSYTGNGRFVAFKHGNAGNAQSIYIDDVTFELIAENDLAVIDLVGNSTPAAQSPTTYTAHVFNWGSQAQDNYTVTLHDSDDNLLATTDGVAINPEQTVEIPLTWTPTQPGTYTIYAKVNLAGDQNTANDQSHSIPVSVQEPGALVVTIGTDTTTNSTTGVPTPYGTRYKNFRQQYLYKADELFANGAAPGLINSLAFEVSAVNNCSPMPNFTIKLKHTQLDELTTTFEDGDYTQVFFEDNFLPIEGWNVHAFDTPFLWNGIDNILVDIITTIIPGDYTQNASVYYTTTPGIYTCLRYQSDSSPAANATTGTRSRNRANIRLFVNVSGMGSLGGLVTSDGVVVPDVNIEINDSIYSTVTDVLGQYNFPYVSEGTYTVTASKLGFESMTLPATIVEDQATTLDFNLIASTSVSVTGFVAGSDQPTVGLEGAQVSLTGIMDYSAVTDATGHFTIPGVLSGNTYHYLVTCEGYSELTGTVTIGNENHDMQTLILDEIAYPPSNVIAEENVAQTEVSLIWNTPTATPPFDDFEQNDGGWVPTASWDPVGDWEWSDSYDVDSFVYAYTGNNVNPPQSAYSGTGMWGTKIHTNYTNSGGFNMLSKTFNLTGIPNPEIRWWSWENVFGSFDYCQLRVNDTIVWGPSWDYTNTQWQERVVSLADYAGQNDVVITFEMYASTVVNYAGWYIDDVYVGPALDRAVAQAPAITPTWMYGLDEQTAAARADELARQSPARTTQRSRETQRLLTGYKVWRLLAENQENEDLWTLLTPTAVPDTTYTDTAWQPLPSGVYKYAVKAVHTNDVLSAPAFSNEIHKGMMGTISGTVTEFGTGNPISGATITAGEYSGTSGADGSYAFLAYQDTYNVTCAKFGYQNAIHPGIVVVGQQTTTLDIVMTEITLPPLNVQAQIETPSTVAVTWDNPTGGGPGSTLSDGFESYPDFAVSFTPWVLVDVDGSPTYGIQGMSWQNQFDAQSFIIFNPNQTTPPLTSFTAHSGEKAAVCFNSTQPPNDDWMITPLLMPQAGDEFKFWARSYSSDDGLERIRVAISQGSTVPADFTIISGATYIEVPTAWTEYSYDLSSYANQPIRLAINCVSHDAFFLAIDDVSMGDAKLANVTPNVNVESTETLARCTGTPTRSLNSFSRIDTSTRGDRALLGYRVWRLSQGAEGNEHLWTSLTPEPITETNLTDDGWQQLVDGSYRWAVKAVYTGGALSPAAMSEALTKVTYIGTIAGIVRSNTNVPVRGATITCGDVVATTNDSGAYSMQVEEGTYTLVASHPNYNTETVENVIVYANQTTTQNFIMTAVDNDDNAQIPVATSLNGNYPNPFNPETTISFSLKEPAMVSIQIFNVQGKLVNTLVNEDMTAGNYTVIWDGKDSGGRNVASGVYYYRMIAGKYSSTRKMIMLK
jgi:hypothetical protein